MDKKRVESLINRERPFYAIADRAEKSRIIDEIQSRTGLSRSTISHSLNMPTQYGIPDRRINSTTETEGKPTLKQRWLVLPKKTRTWVIVIAIIILLYLCGLLTACTPQIQEVIVTQIHTQVVETTREVEVTRLVIVTATPPPPTPTKAYQKWTLDQARQAIVDAGLEYENAHEMTKDDYGLAPMNAAEAWRFIIPSLCSDCGGRIYSFDDPAKLAEMKEYYDKISEMSAAFFSWIFVQDNILIQINGDLPEAQALQYQQALENMK